MLIYGAHLLRNGAAKILERMMAGGWLTHLATNGAGTIHDWEYAWLGASTESVQENVATGTFGTWHETATNIHLASWPARSTGWATAGRWAGSSMKTARRFPAWTSSRKRSPPQPRHPLTAARADLLRAIVEQHWPAGRVDRPSPLEARVDPGAGIPARHSDDRPSRHRLRHHLQSPGVQRRGHRPGG